MPPPSHSEFLRSRFYRCGLAFHKRNEQRLKNIRDLLEKVDNKKSYKRTNRKNYVSTYKIPDFDGSNKQRTNNEDQAILDADKDKSDWVRNDSGEYVLTLGEMTVMKIPEDMYLRLRPFQRDAVKWIASVGPVGGILADDMGMGKTFMSIASLGARMRVNRVRMVLIVAPVSVLAGWAEEGKKFLSKFSKNVRIIKVHGSTQKNRQKIVRNAWKNSSLEQPHVIISSWGLVASAKTINAFLPPSGHHWDYVVLDEAHLIKNHKSNRSKCCRRICHKAGTKRLLLTGTPFQNDTTELWSITHMATAGKVLGKLKDFNKEYGKPLSNARCRNASSCVMKEGAKANDQLQGKLKPYLLRRCKIDFLANELPPKLDICVWVKPSNQQKKMYKEKVEATGYLAQNMLSSDKTVANKAKMGAFKVLADLKKLCGHPLRLLMSGQEKHVLRSVLEQTKLDTILRDSKKLELTLHMLKGFKAEDHKTLLFSQSTKNLDIIQHVLLNEGQLSVCRLDGSVSEKRRQDTVECFQNGMFNVLLLSTGAGGVGLTLTRASRVILFDPSWNPSEDAQAVDRAYRIGQTREVRVYRLFMGGGIEEKMYEKQVHKSGLEKTIFTQGKPEERYFDKNELCKVFAQIPDGSCELLKRFENEGVAQVADAHRHDLVRAHPSVIGISNHSNVYHQKRKSAFSDAPNIVSKKAKCTDSNETAETLAGTASESDAAPEEEVANEAGASVVSENETATEDAVSGVESEHETASEEAVASEMVTKEAGVVSDIETASEDAVAGVDSESEMVTEEAVLS